MTDNSPEIARTVPPLTGASSIAMPRSRRRRAKRRAANGSIVLMLRTMCPAWADAMMPRSPVMTSSAWSVVSTIEIVRSTKAATAAGECSTAAPASTSGSSFAGSMSWTTSENPCFTRLSAIGPPMAPRPMNPTLPAMPITPLVQLPEL